MDSTAESVSSHQDTHRATSAFSPENRLAHELLFSLSAKEIAMKIKTSALIATALTLGLVVAPAASAGPPKHKNKHRPHS